MRFMIIVKATADTEAGVMPEEKLLAEMQKFHEELQKAGVLLDASGLKPSSKGWRIKYSGAKRSGSFVRIHGAQSRAGCDAFALQESHAGSEPRPLLSR